MSNAEIGVVDLGNGTVGVTTPLRLFLGRSAGEMRGLPFVPDDVPDCAVLEWDGSDFLFGWTSIDYKIDFAGPKEKDEKMNTDADKAETRPMSVPGDRLGPDSPFAQNLKGLLNCHSIDTLCNTPDYLLAQYVLRCLENLRDTNADNVKWHGWSTELGKVHD